MEAGKMLTPTEKVKDIHKSQEATILLDLPWVIITVHLAC